MTTACPFCGEPLLIEPAAGLIGHSLPGCERFKEAGGDSGKFLGMLELEIELRRVGALGKLDE